MMHRKLLLCAAAALALASCGQSPENEAESTLTAANDSNLAMAADSDLAPAVSGVELVAQATEGDLYEIAAAKLALDDAQSPEVRKFAQAMVTDHDAASAELAALIPSTGLKVEPPAALDDRHQAMIEELRGADPDDFDSTYLDQQTDAHREALSLLRNYAISGDNDILKQFAATTALKVEAHLQKARALDEAGQDDAKDVLPDSGT